MTRVLVLGGTGWLSGRIARCWLDRGAAVTCVARGGRAAPKGAELIAADRDDASAYDAVVGREWDEVVDVSSDAGHVASAVAALAHLAHHWTYVSTVSVYAATDEIGANEDAPLLEPAAAGDEYDYGRAKVAAEASVRAGLGERAAVVRPGLIVGPGDPTDRFGYWVGRFALAAADPVLVPEAEGRFAQVIDVRDLAGFVVELGASGWGGVVDAVGDPVPLSDLLDEARSVGGHSGAVRRAGDAWLEAHGVAYWMGPRSLPLWLPADMPGFARRDNARYRAAGGALRPLADTLAATLADETARGLDRARRSGLSRAEESALLAEPA